MIRDKKFCDIVECDVLFWVPFYRLQKLLRITKKNKITIKNIILKSRKKNIKQSQRKLDVGFSLCQTPAGEGSWTCNPIKSNPFWHKIINKQKTTPPPPPPLQFQFISKQGIGGRGSSELDFTYLGKLSSCNMLVVQKKDLI